MLHVTSSKYLKDYKIWLSFDDGVEGVVDLKKHLKGEMFESLLNVDKFSEVKFDEELETIIWPNGADFAPEFLKDILISE